jgi:hypothetical protein
MGLRRFSFQHPQPEHDKKGAVMDEKKNTRSVIRKSSISELGGGAVSMPEFFDGIAKIVEQARSNIERSVNVAMCVTYYNVGRLIVEQEQSGANRAAYGKKLLDELSAYLTERCGKGWSIGNLRNARQFYQVYSSSIHQSLISESEKGRSLSEFARKEGFTLASWRSIPIKGEAHR